MDSIGALAREFCCDARMPLSPLHWLPTLALVVLFWISMGRGKGFAEFLNWQGVVGHRSSRMDLWLFLIDRCLTVLGFGAMFVITPSVARWVADVSPLPPLFANGLSPLAMAVAIFVLFDFAQYWMHRLYHITALWPLHAVHHSAEVLTPLTTFRTHPLALCISAAFNSMIMGVGLGLLVGALSPDLQILEIANANAMVVLANATVVNLHHSHLRISFGPILERILVSPSQHQIHHSRNPRHYNRNYGNVLAIWDWIFGTLYLIQDNEVITFGLDGAAEAPLMTQRLWPMLTNPIRRVFR